VAVDATGVLANKTVVSISAGDGFSIVLTSDGKLYSWGMNGYGALGVSFYYVLIVRMEHRILQLFLLL
jgi:alpha-tubulin suppressor-like RCC1 family protein